jgi:hypothetical protein
MTVGSKYASVNVVYLKGVFLQQKKMAVLVHLDAKGDGSQFLRNVGDYLSIDKASHPSRLELSTNILVVMYEYNRVWPTDITYRYLCTLSLKASQYAII